MTSHSASGTHWTGLATGFATGIVGVAAAAVGILVAGCVSQPESFAGGGGGGGFSSSSGSGSAGGGPSAQPMLVVVDTDQTLNAAGGQGVGVFVEYQAGGHWTVRWACDTALTGLSCQFLVHVTLAAAPSVADVDSGQGFDGGGSTGIFNLLDQEQSPNASVTQASAGTLLATSTTTHAIDGVGFDTPAGATITLEATVNGEDNGAFLFFVQDGKVNGGYQGTLSDPIMLVPSAP
jgi:hypothetical protein